MAQNIVEYALKIDTKSGTASLKAIGNQSKKTEDQFDGLSNQSKKTGMSLDDMGKDAAISALALLELGKRALNAVGSIVSLGQAQADLVNDLNDLSNRSGIATENIQALQFAFRASGQSAGDVKGVLDKMPRVMAELTAGTGKSSKAFKRLGIDVRDASGAMKSTDQIFNEAIHALQGIESQSQKAAIATEVFGRQAGNMLQALGQTEGLQDFRDFTEEFGTKTGKEASAQAARFQQAMAGLDKAIDAVGQAFATAFGDDGFVTLVKVAGQGMIFFAEIVKSAIKEIKDSFDTMVLSIKEAVLIILVETESMNQAFMAFIGDTKSFVEVSQRLNKLKKDLEDVQTTMEDRRMSRFADLVNNEASALEKAADAAERYGEKLEAFMQKTGSAKGGMGSVPDMPTEIKIELIGEAELLSLLGEMEQVSGLDWEGFDPFANLAKVEEEGLSKISEAFIVLSNSINAFSGNFSTIR